MLIAGLVLLGFGGDVLVRGASELAAKAGISPLIIGLVIVGFGTSMPELVTSVEAVLEGSPAIAWGNVAGSNLANGLMILGATALIAPVIANGSAKLRDPMVALIASLLILACGWYAIGSVMVGALMLALLFCFIGWCYWQERAYMATHDGQHSPAIEDPRIPRTWWRPVIRLVSGLALLIFGGWLLVGSAIQLARMAGLSEALIGATVVAIGTSLPELATSVIAALKRHAGIALGNVIGSNIYNIFAIGGVTMIITGNPPSPELNAVEWPLVVGSAVLILFICAVIGRVGRAVGATLLLSYAAYLAYAVSQI